MLKIKCVCPQCPSCKRMYIALHCNSNIIGTDRYDIYMCPWCDEITVEDLFILCDGVVRITWPSII